MQQHTPQQQSKQTTIREEITRQLSMMKKQIDIELKRDIEAAKESIIRDLREYVDGKIAMSAAGLSNDINKQLMAVGNKDGVSKEMAVAISTNTCQQVYKKIIGELNNTIVPKVNHLETMMKYQSDDTHQLLNEYRFAVYDQNKPPVKSITDGKSLHISEHVGLFFNEHD